MKLLNHITTEDFEGKEVEITIEGKYNDGFVSSYSRMMPIEDDDQPTVEWTKLSVDGKEVTMSELCKLVGDSIKPHVFEALWEAYYDDLNYVEQ
jgi:hypothetical protein